VLVANNATVRYDANFNREALLNGVDSLVNETERIPTKYQMAFTQPIVGKSSAADHSAPHCTPTPRCTLRQCEA
jgi:hypothetical protein